MREMMDKEAIDKEQGGEQQTEGVQEAAARGDTVSVLRETQGVNATLFCTGGWPADAAAAAEALTCEGPGTAQAAKDAVALPLLARDLMAVFLRALLFGDETLHADATIMPTLSSSSSSSSSSSKTAHAPLLRLEAACRGLSALLLPAAAAQAHAMPSEHLSPQ